MKEKDTTTLRIPTNIRLEMQKEAELMGISLNSYILVAANIGRKVLNSDVTFAPSPDTLG